MDWLNTALEARVQQRYEFPGLMALMQAARGIQAASSEGRFQLVFQALEASQRAGLNAFSDLNGAE